MKKSSSFHSLSADVKLNFIEKRLWKIFNWLNNNYFPNRYNGLHLKNFETGISKNNRDKIPEKASPSRFLSDLFWMKMDWDYLRAELNEFHIFDTGAGSGKYGIKINESSKGASSYFGVDLFNHQEWEAVMEEHSYITMKQHGSDDILGIIPNNTNVFVSQSAIEHFKYDLLYFQQIKRFIEGKKKPVIQIHLFPSAACLRLYGLHGLRQYTPRAVSSIAGLFNDAAHYSTLYNLGGKNCNQLHYSFITKPLRDSKGIDDYRNTRTKEYKALLAEAIEKDNKENQQTNLYEPSFYALVIQSYFKHPLL